MRQFGCGTKTMLHYTTSYVIDAPLEDVWAFFERSDAFERLNPPWSKAKLYKKTGGLEVGSEVHLKLPLGIEWKVRHVEYERHRFFVDAQIKGPFRKWEHRHGFERLGPNQTRLTEKIVFSLPFPWITHFIAGWLIKRQLNRLFAFRRSVLQESLVQ